MRAGHRALCTVAEGKFFMVTSSSTRCMVLKKQGQLSLCDPRRPELG